MLKGVKVATRHASSGLSERPPNSLPSGFGSQMEAIVDSTYEVNVITPLRDEVGGAHGRQTLVCVNAVDEGAIDVQYKVTCSSAAHSLARKGSSKG